MLNSATATRRALLVAAASGWSLTAAAQRAGQPYAVAVWARVLFGPDGQPAEVALVDPDSYPAAFAENVLARIARARIPPPTIDGRVVTLRSGVRLRFEVTPTANGGGTVRFDSISMAPLPVSMALASYPEDLRRSPGWDGSATGVCTVGLDGQCSAIEVLALPGMPGSLRRHMRASMALWRFEPQQLDGQAIAGEYRLKINYHTYDAYPEDFRQDKFLRLLRTR
jgi:hypothetical protein